MGMAKESRGQDSPPAAARGCSAGIVSAVVCALFAVASGCPADQPEPAAAPRGTEPELSASIAPPAEGAIQEPEVSEPVVAHADSNALATSNGVRARVLGASETELAVPPPLCIERDPPPRLQTGWAHLTEHAAAGERAWIEGGIAGDDRLTISTHNVRRFTLNLTRLRLNWEKRIVLRMDGYNSQLTRKRWPKLNFVRTASGAWDVVDED
jgi:hypothetical protein